MYIVNTIKRVSLYGNAFIHLKKRIAREDTVLIHEISHNYKLLYITFLHGITFPPSTFEIQGSTLKFCHLSLR